MTYTVKQIQEHFGGVSQGTVLHWLSTGQLKYLSLGRDPGKKRQRYRVTQAQLDEFELTRTSALPPPKPTRRRRHKSEDVIEFIK